MLGGAACPVVVAAVAVVVAVVAVAVVVAVAERGRLVADCGPREEHAAWRRWHVRCGESARAAPRLPQRLPAPVPRVVVLCART